MPRLTGLAPVLLVRDVEAAPAHYRDALGFEVEPWPHRENGHVVYGYATRDACTIHFARAEEGHARPVPPAPFSALGFGQPLEG